MNEQIEEGYRRAESIVAQSGSNLVTMFGYLSAEKSRSMNALYAFCRISDDIVDGDSESDPDVQTESRTHQLSEWTGKLREALSGRGTDDSLIAAYVHTVEKYSIPHQYTFDLLRGIAHDLVPHSVQTYSELRTYCYLVASSVGLACLKIWGIDAKEDDYLRPALDCGIGMQMVNILRDLHEDLPRRRCYLPKEDWLPRSLDLEDFTEPISDEHWQDLIQFECQRAQNHLHSSLQLLPMLDRTGRRLLRGLVSRYWRLLKKIRRDPQNVLRMKTRLTGWEKWSVTMTGAVGFPLLRIPAVKL